MMAAAGAGCSSLIDSVPAWKPGEPPVQCTVHPVPPIVDLSAAALAVGVGGMIAVADQSTSCPGCESKGIATVVIGVPMVIVGALYAWSGLSGLHDNARCEQVQREQALAGSAEPFYCTATYSLSLGSCTEQREACERARVAFTSAGHPMAECEPQLRVQCFEIDSTRHCAPSEASCAALRSAVAGRIGDAVLSPCAPFVEERRVVDDGVLAARNETLRRAWTLTRYAATAARAGDCTTVEKLDSQVRALDRDFYDRVFARDAAIARCLATSSTGR